MQEYSSVTASSYDPDALVALLNERSAEGWAVVSIVGAGTNIVAYLAREQSDAAPVASVADAAVTADETAAVTAAETAAESAAPVDEPAGWAAAPESLTETTVNPVVPTAAEETAATVTEEPAAAAEPAQAAAPESAVPAGWYADPSGRFELRYWDGAAWTEHVSRAGQQYTDPPVA